MLSGQWAEHTALMGSSAQCGGVRDAGSKQFSPVFFLWLSETEDETDPSAPSKSYEYRKRKQNIITGGKLHQQV